MNLCKAYYEWQKSLEELEDSLKHMNNHINHMKECEDRGIMKGGMAFLNRSFKEHKNSCDKLADNINKLF